MDEEVLEGGGRNTVTRVGDVVHRTTGPWAASVHSLLRHLEAGGFDGAPRIVGTGFGPDGRETLSYVAGATPSRNIVSADAMAEVGVLLRRMHDATNSFVPPADAVWRDWFGRTLGTSETIIGHCDTGPWNIIERDGRPVAFIDWEEAGPVDRYVEIAQTCWLTAQLHDDDVAERNGLADAAERARHMRAIVDGYGLAAQNREGLVDTMIEFAVHAAADEARRNEPLEAIAWRVRGAAWMLRHRMLLENALR
ncbi:MAG: phosphotransferase [Devosia sp.]